MPVYRADLIQPFQAINVLSDPGYLPGPKIIPNACMVRFNWQLTSGKVGHNVMYASWTGTPALSATVAQQVYAAAIAGAAWSTFAGFLAPTTSFTGVTLLDVRSTTGVEYNSTGAASPGTSTGTAMPDEVAASVKLSTANRGPSGRGRVYLPGFATNAIGAGNTIAPAAVSAINAWMLQVISNAFAPIVGNITLGLPERAGYTSPITGRVFPPRPAQTVPITAVALRDNHWDSQRRRGLR